MATRVDIAVTYDPQADPIFSYSAPAKRTTDGVIIPVVDQGVNLVVFDLKFSNVGSASFLTEPIQYAESDSDGVLRPSADRPPGFVLQRNGDTQVTLVDINTLSGQFHFFVIILADGKIVGDDPILVNQPPPRM